MADYFSEMGFEPLGEGETPNGLLLMARLLRDMGFLDESQAARLPPPASKTFVDNLAQIKIHQTGLECTVCLKEFSLGEMAKMLPCDHQFHPVCILPWLSKTSTCPLCRHQLPTDDEGYEEYKKQKEREKARESELQDLHNSMFT